MAETRRAALRQMLRPWTAKVVISLSVAAGLYQFGCDQFGWPTLPVLWGMTGFLMPWWGWLLVAQAGVLYALFEYVRRNVGTQLSDGISPELEARAEREMRKLRERAEQLDQRYKTVIHDYQNMCGLEARFTDMLDGLKIEIQRKDETRGANLSALQEEISRIDVTYAGETAGVRADIEKLSGECAAHRSLDSDSLKHRFDSIYSSLLAIFYREKLSVLAGKIDNRAALLDTMIKNGKALSLETWNEWKAEENAWRSDLNDFYYMAGFYYPNAKEEIEAFDKHVYEKGAWQFREEQFPTHESDPHLRSNAVHRYKTYAIAAGKWGDVRDKVLDVVRKVAFEGYSPPHWQRAQNDH